MTNDLNPQQKEAVHYNGGPLLIVAGAGSGKTRTLTQRIAHMIASGAESSRILAITFTNKAAAEMRSRILALSANGKLQSEKNNAFNQRDLRFATGDLPFIGTFHSWGVRVLKREARLLNRTPNFSIFDEDDASRLLKTTIKTMDINSEEYPPAMFRRRISTIKNELQDIGELASSWHPKDKLIARVYTSYEAALAENNAFDFDDLIEKVVRLFRHNPEALARYHDYYHHIFIDEYQDVNTSQYRLIRLLVGGRGHISVVGDDAQCLLPTTPILTPHGSKEIQKLKKGGIVFAASGDGAHCAAKITNVHKRKYKGPMVRIVLSNNKTLQLTPNHLLFARLQPSQKIHFVYLMYRKDKGFRIGITKGSRWGRNKEQIGLIVRNNQEKADKVWVLRVCNSKREAEYYEYFYAFNYGIPTVVFSTANRSMQLQQEQIDQLFAAIDTKQRAMKLMEKELLYFSYPHWIPQGTIRHRSRRLRIRLTLFDDRRKSVLHPWGMSRLSVNTKDERLRTAIEALGYSTRKGKLSDWRFEICSTYYDELERIVQQFERIDGEIETVRSACLTPNKRLFFQPASHIRPSMVVAVHTPHGIEEATVTEVSIEQYDGIVYDLDIDNVHNYIANGFVVHNSIYAFRGSDFRNFLNFDKDWPDAKIIFLDENYRSTGNIIAAATALIKNNTVQKPKRLWTAHDHGEKITIFGLQNADDEAAYIAERVKELLMRANADPAFAQCYGGAQPEIAILYRTNAQSRPIEYQLLKHGVPYKIYGSLRFYDRMEIKDIISTLHYALNPQHSLATERIKKSFYKKEAAILLAELPELGTNGKIVEIIDFVLTTTKYIDYLKTCDNGIERIENVNELIAFAGTYNHPPSPEATDGHAFGLAAFLEQVALASAIDAPNGTCPNDRGRSVGRESQTANSETHGAGKGVVNLMTVHAAKGLEFNQVFVAGCNEGLFPHERSLFSDDDLAEERRLMYVAMTRARKMLTLTFFNAASRFLYEIPPELTDFRDDSMRKRKSFGSFEEDEDYIDYN